MTGWCMSRAATRVCIRIRSRVRVRSPSQHYEKTASFIREEEKSELSNQINKLGLDRGLSASECGNRVMVVVDSSPEARGALDWVLSHTVQSQDKIILHDQRAAIASFMPPKLSRKSSIVLVKWVEVTNKATIKKVTRCLKLTNLTIHD